MIDQKKVIKGLMVCVDRIPGKYGCNECPYEIDGNYCEINMAKDALALLKEQEPVEPRIQTSYSGNGTWWYICGMCNTTIDPKDKYCHECGRKVKWE